MKIDWFTFAAQVVNFLVLVGILRWLLYGPIVRAMKEREQKIADRLAAAKSKQAEADAKANEYDGKLHEIQQRRVALFEDAKRDAEAERRRLLKETRAEVEHQRQQWQTSLDRERDDLAAEVRLQAGHAGVETARHTLAQLAHADLEQSICESFVRRLHDVGEQQREEILHHLGDGEAEVLIRSAFEMSSEQQQRLCETIHQRFGRKTDVLFENSDELICGVELIVGGYRFGWNIKDFLRDIELAFAERLKSSQ